MRVPTTLARGLGAILVRFSKRFGADARDKPGHDGVIAPLPF